MSAPTKQPQPERHQLDEAGIRAIARDEAWRGVERANDWRAYLWAGYLARTARPLVVVGLVLYVLGLACHYVAKRLDP